MELFSAPEILAHFSYIRTKDPLLVPFYIFSGSVSLPDLLFLVSLCVNYLCFVLFFWVWDLFRCFLVILRSSFLELYSISF
ncbi:hypothetical protein Pfo_012611 [Paulownia fortunei]|nr:hypothetical protein Pfo_012611 [Paulownia fortunei]